MKLFLLISLVSFFTLTQSIAQETTDSKNKFRKLNLYLEAGPGTIFRLNANAGYFFWNRPKIHLGIKAGAGLFGSFAPGYAGKEVNGFAMMLYGKKYHFIQSGLGLITLLSESKADKSLGAEHNFTVNLGYRFQYRRFLAMLGGSLAAFKSYSDHLLSLHLGPGMNF